MAKTIGGKDEVALAPSKPKGWIHFVAGGIGGMCGAIVTSPLDVVKTRLQSDMYVDRWKKESGKVHSHQAKGIIRNAFNTMKKLGYHFVETGQLLKQISTREGPRALFRGLGPTLVGVIPARSINFYTYGNGKVWIADHFNGGHESSSVHLCAAALAGIVTATTTNPIWVVKTRLQLQHNQAQKADEEARKRSVRSVQPTLQAASASSRSFSTSSASMNADQKKTTKGSGHWSTRISSTRSLPSRGISTPFTNTRSFFQSQLPPPRPGINSFGMTMQIIRTEGINGLYKGMSASYLGVAEGTIQWVLYERLKRMSAPKTDSIQQSGFFRSPDEPSRAQKWMNTVGAAGTAKLVASLITYPHEVIRTRLRQEPPPGQPRKYTGLVQTLRIVLKEEGVVSMYGGLSAHLLRVVPNAAIMFVVYETMLNLSKK
ncbi:mitochondrial carrier [Meira miltonrushii]|uniref:Mitochondrial carrier n=1 Tax=Meira miltonrushii TaxID=1280837 RepID=A0A316VJD0_9BASI|nr:mitochondrial carrier [Meira miltonrushii]PWN37168.1 mitochondrial carrier [Meira miltonrushii]